MVKKQNKVFIKITNEMVYKEIQDVHKDLYTQLKQINNHLATLNGSVKVNKWISRVSLSVCLIIVGALLKVVL